MSTLVPGLVAAVLLAALPVAAAGKPELDLRYTPKEEIDRSVPRTATEERLDCDDPIQGDGCVTVSTSNSAPIPDNNFLSQVIEITESDLEQLGIGNCIIQDLNAAVDVTHPQVGQLQMFLFRPPAGPTAALYDPPLTCTAMGVDAVFDDEASLPANACPATGTSYQPVTPLDLFDGGQLSGSWGLDIVDVAPGGSGMLDRWGFAVDVDCDTVETPPCLPDPQTLCLNNRRFRVTSTWKTFEGTTGDGMAVQLTPDTGYFWFFDETNVEFVIKILDACGDPFNRFWVFAGGLTNVEVEIRVEDTQSGEENLYTNPLRTPFQPIQDTNAFATCP